MCESILRTLRCVWLAAVLLALAAGAALAQSGATTGVAGRVTDTTGAPLAGASVMLVRPDTGIDRTATTSPTGNWEMRFVTPGTYRLTVEFRGFKSLRREGIVVSTGEVASINVQLEVGTVTEAIEVTADARMITGLSAAIMRTLDRKELDSLPTSARNITQLLAIEPGVSADISELLSNDNASISPSVNGARTTNNSFVFNGIDVTNLLCCNSRINGGRGTIDAGGGTLSRNIAPAPETLEEVKLQTSLYDAATGRNGGGIFQVVSKSGTNNLAGAFYLYSQNDALMANEYFFARNGLEKQQLKRNEGGLTLGGPIARSRTFFFGSYQATRAESSFVDEASNTALLPSALGDDRSDDGINRFASAIWNPSLNGPVNFSAINPISRALLKAKLPDGTFLVPSGAGGSNCAVREDQVAESCQVISVIPATFRQDQFTANVDHQFSRDNRLAGKFFYSDQPSVDPLANGDALTLHERDEKTFQRTFSLSDVHVFRSGMVNEFRGGFFRNRNDSVPISHFTNAEFGIENPFASKVPDLTQISIDAEDVGSGLRFGTLGDGTRIFDRQTTWTVGNTLSLLRGRHSLRLGGELRRHYMDGDLQETQNRRHNFDDWFSFLTVGYLDPGDRNRARQIADSSLNFGETVRNFRMTDWSWFIADDWRVSDSFTLNLGLRHEYLGFPSEKNGFLALYDFDAAVATGNLQDGFVFASNFDPASVPGASSLALNKASTPSIVPPDYNNFMPRVGFAWTPGTRKNVVVRGGYGMFYERTTGAFANSLRQSPPFFREVQLDNLGNWNTVPKDVPMFPVPSMSVGFDDGEPFLMGDNNPGVEFEAFETQMVSRNLFTPYMQQWNLTTQLELRPNWMLEIGYVGSRGSNLLQWTNLNQALDVNGLGFLARSGVPGGGFSSNYFRIDDDEFVNTPTPECDLFDDPDQCVIPAELRGPLLGLDEDEGANFLSNGGRSTYHSLQLSLQKRFTRGYMFNLNYTLSKSMDTYSDEGVYQVEHDQSRPELNWAVSDFDRRHRMILSWTWELPFKGNQFAEGWQLSGIGTFQSGRPFTVTDDDFSGILFASQSPRPNLAPGKTLKDQTTSGSVEDRLDAYLNRDAFESSGTEFGALGRNTVVGPAQQRLDLNLSKLTRLRGSSTLELRLEIYNVANTPTFRNPESDLGSGDFGMITRTRGGPRLVQLGAKVRF